MTRIMANSGNTQPPEYIGRYQIKEKIAKGGMATIYRGLDNLIGRNVAIKITNTTDEAWGNTDSQKIMRQFEREAQISGQLSHHNFVTIYDAGRQDDLCYLVMELMDGTTLDKIIKGAKPKRDMRQKLEILIQVARALHHGHQRGIIHRDIKPSNIMALSNGQTKVMDFGVATISDESNIKVTEETIESVGGTPYYMSPEQINKVKVDAKSDLFSLAVVAYELLSGKRPFTSDNMFNLYEKILRSEPVALQEIDPSIPDKVAALIIICLNKSANLRLPSCKAFADQLDEIINNSFFEDEGKVITEETLKLLRKYRESFPFFFDMDNSQIYKLLQVCQVKKYKKGDVIFKEGTVAREMYLVMSGDVRITRGNNDSGSILINILKRGQVFGEMGIIDGAPRSATAIAETDCQALILHQVSLLRCDDNTAGKIYRNLSHILSGKLRSASVRLEDINRQTNI